VTKDSHLHAVTCVGEHGLFTGDIVSICDQHYRAEVISDTEFNALQVDASGVDSLATWDVKKESLVTLVRRENEPAEVDYVDLKNNVWNPTFYRGSEDHKSILQKHSAFLSKVKLDLDCDQVAAKLGLVDPDKSYIFNLQDRMFHLRTSKEVSYGALAGVVSSQVLNLLTKRFRPLCQWIHFDLPVNYARSKASQLGFAKHSILLNGLTPLGVRIFEKLLECQQFVCKIIVASDEVMSKSLLFNASSEICSAKDLDRPVYDVLKGTKTRQKLNFSL